MVSPPQARIATRAAVIRYPAISAGLGRFGAIQAVALEVSPMNVHDATQIEHNTTDFARSSKT